MKNISLLIKPASSLCNLRCSYCFYADVVSLRQVSSFGIMEKEIVEKIIFNIISDLDEGGSASFAFQGGEPTLAGLEWYKAFIKIVDETLIKINKKIKISYSIQTNGIVIDNEWCEFLKENNFLVGLSLDGEAAFHNENRLDSHGNGTFSKVMKVKRLFEKYKVDYNVLWVLTAKQARYPKKAWNFIITNKIDYVQFIPCLDNLDSDKLSAFQLTPQRFASFYNELLNYWAKNFINGNYVSIKLFDDLFNLLKKGVVNACGFTGFCQFQFVIEADGSVYPCDFYVIDKWQTGTLVENKPSEILENNLVREFLNRPKLIEKICCDCKWSKICGQGCPRMKNVMYIDYEKKFCGYKTFLNESSSNIQKVLDYMTITRS